MKHLSVVLIALGVALIGCKGHGTASADRPTAAECATLADHLLAALLADARSKKPELSSLGPAQQGMLEWAQREAAKKIEAKCATDFTRERYACVMGVQTEEDLKACDAKFK
jgi:hypothetical protein